MDPALASTVPALFAAAIAFCAFVYVLADGFDLGVGIVLLAAPRSEERDRMIASIAPFWDGNETWLLMGGTLLFAAFPAAYDDMLSMFHLPILLMLLALVLRAIALAVRPRVARFRSLCDVAFAGGSIVAVLCQGLALGGLIGATPVQGGLSVGGPLGFVGLPGLLCAIGLLGGYALLGAGWLVWKTEAASQVFGREIARVAVILAGAMMLLVAAWSAWTGPELAARWSDWPRATVLALLLVVTAATLVVAWRGTWSAPDHRTFMLAMTIFVLGFVGLAVGLWPHVAPHQATIWEASSHPRTLMSFDKGVAIIIAIVLFFQVHAYWAFRGAVAQGNARPPQRR